MLNTPLPGDLVIRPERDQAAMRQVIVFVVGIWPQMDVIGGPYQSYGYAKLQAKAVAAKRGVQVWREYSMDPERSALENVSETDV